MRSTPKMHSPVFLCLNWMLDWQGVARHTACQGDKVISSAQALLMFTAHSICLKQSCIKSTKEGATRQDC